MINHVNTTHNTILAIDDNGLILWHKHAFLLSEVGDKEREWDDLLDLGAGGQGTSLEWTLRNHENWCWRDRLLTQWREMHHKWTGVNLA